MDITTQTFPKLDAFIGIAVILLVTKIHPNPTFVAKESYCGLRVLRLDSHPSITPPIAVERNST